MKKFCTSLREHVINVITFEKKEILPLTKEELKSHQDAKVCYICGKTQEKYKTFSILIEKEVTNIDEDVNESIVTIPYVY